MLKNSLLTSALLVFFCLSSCFCTKDGMNGERILSQASFNEKTLHPKQMSLCGGVECAAGEYCQCSTGWSGMCYCVSDTTPAPTIHPADPCQICDYIVQAAFAYTTDTEEQMQNDLLGRCQYLRGYYGQAGVSECQSTVNQYIKDIYADAKTGWKYPDPTCPKIGKCSAGQPLMSINSVVRGRRV